jgi:hypothetical protein
MKSTGSGHDAEEPVVGSVLLPQEAEVDKPQAWEMIEKGRYQPRRIRGSLLGRELG